MNLKKKEFYDFGFKLSINVSLANLFSLTLFKAKALLSLILWFEKVIT